MSKIKRACKNHPDRLTARRCYYCKEPICTECQLRLGHHLFCSRKCYYLWKAGNFYSRIKTVKNLPVYLLLIFILISNLSLLAYFNWKLNKISAKPEVQKQIAPKDSTWFRIDTSMIKAQGELQFKIKGSPGLAVSLWRDAKMISMRSVGKGTSYFGDLPLHFGLNRFAVWAHRADGKTVLVDSFRVNWYSARLEFLSRPVSAVPVSSKKIALTFDAGSTNRGSAELLNILREKGLRCTMFITGTFLKRYPETVRQIVSDGHEVGNHTFNHPHLTTYTENHIQESRRNVDRAFVYRQLLRADSLFNKITKKHLAPYWRAPFGEYNKQILIWAAEAGYKHVGWSKHCDALDWVEDSTAALYRSSEEILKHFLNLEAKSGLRGKIILMHLGTDRKNDFPYLILPALIDSLRQRGYTFYTVSGLLNQKAKLTIR